MHSATLPFRKSSSSPPPTRSMSPAGCPSSSITSSHGSNGQPCSLTPPDQQPHPNNRELQLPKLSPQRPNPTPPSSASPVATSATSAPASWPGARACPSTTSSPPATPTTPSPSFSQPANTAPNWLVPPSPTPWM